MAKYENPPLKLEECTKEVVTDFVRGTESVFRFDLFGEGRNEDLNKPFTTFDGKFHWSTNKDFFVYITNLTGTSNIRDANSKLYETFTKTPEYTEATMTSAPDSHVSSNRPSTEQLEQFGKEGEERAEKIKQTQVQAKTEVEAAIKRKEEIYAFLKDKRVIVTPKEDLQKATLTPKEKTRIWNLAQAIKADEISTQKAIEEKIKESVRKSSPEIQQNITNPIIKRTAADLIEKITPFGVYKSADEIPNDVTIINPISPLVAISNPDDPKLKSLIPDDNVRTELAKSAQAISLSLEAKNNIDYSLTQPLFADSENISKVFYPQSIIQFQIADNQESKDEEDRGARIDFEKTYNEGRKIWDNWQKIKKGTTTVDKVVESTSVVPYPQITTTISTAGETTSFLTVALPTTVGAITGFGTVTLANTFLLSGAHTAPLLADGFAQSLFLPSTTGIAISTPVFETIGGLEISTGALVTMSAPIAASEMIFNIPYGIAIGKGALLVATGEIASTGAPIIAFGVKMGQSGIGAVISSTGIKVAATGVFAEIGAALGSWAPIVGTAIGAAIGWVVGKIAEKIPWKKIAPFLLGGIAFLFAGPVVGAAVGVGSFVLISGVSGAALGATVGGVVSFFGAIGGAFIGAIATPIIATILVIPVMVALILFIINSGAYIVPPSASTFANVINPYIEVTKTPTPPGPFANTELPLTVEYKITITAKKETLQNIRLDYECGVVKDGPKVNCPTTDPVVPTTLNDVLSGSTYSFTYKQTYSGVFTDSLIMDTITVTADIINQTEIKSTASAGVKIGNPPEDCPSIWPVEGKHNITQTPNGGYSHRGVEAMDIGNLPIGSTVRATHSGVATTNFAGGYGMYVDVISNCGGKMITTRYAHLVSSSIQNGREVLMGAKIGNSGYGGTGPHLHYEFLGGIQMVPPFIPKPLIRNCSSDAGLCGSIP